MNSETREDINQRALVAACNMAFEDAEMTPVRQWEETTLASANGAEFFPSEVSPNEWLIDEHAELDDQMERMEDLINACEAIEEYALKQAIGFFVTTDDTDLIQALEDMIAANDENFPASVSIWDDVCGWDLPRTLRNIGSLWNEFSKTGYYAIAIALEIT